MSDILEMIEHKKYLELETSLPDIEIMQGSGFYFRKGDGISTSLSRFWYAKIMDGCGRYSMNVVNEKGYIDKEKCKKDVLDYLRGRLLDGVEQLEELLEKENK